jgi:S1-C subfamily serine protease
MNILMKTFLFILWPPYGIWKSFEQLRKYIRTFSLFFVLVAGLFESTACAEDISRDVMERVTQGTVYIETFGCSVNKPESDEILVSSGSGCIVDPDGMILTNTQVVPSVSYLDKEQQPVDQREIDGLADKLLVEDLFALSRTRVTVRLRSGQSDSRVYEAQVIASDFDYSYSDLVLLRIKTGTPLPELSLVQGRLSKHDKVWAFGYPGGGNLGQFVGNRYGPEVSVRSGRITTLTHQDPHSNPIVTKIEHSCRIEQSSNGSPLVDSKGRVIGVNARRTGSHSFFAIPTRMVDDGFGPTLWWRLWEKSILERRETLRVDPSDRSALPTLAAAIKKSRPGFTIQLSPGRHLVGEHIDFNDGVHVRGAGIGKTTLVVRTEFPGLQPETNRIGLGYGGGAFDGGARRSRFGVEISNMTIESDNRSTLIIADAYDWLLHDLELVQKSKKGGCLFVTNRSYGVQIINCRCKSPASSRYANIRVTDRSDVRMQGVQAKSLLVDRKCSIVAAGCRFNGRCVVDYQDQVRGLTSRRSPGNCWQQSVLITGATHARFEGCNFDLSSLDFDDNVLSPRHEMRHIQVLGDCDMSLIGNYFAFDLNRSHPVGGGVDLHEIVKPSAYLNTFKYLNPAPMFTPGLALVGQTPPLRDESFYGKAIRLLYKTEAHSFAHVRNNLLIDAKLDATWPMYDGSLSERRKNTLREMYFHEAKRLDEKMEQQFVSTLSPSK